MNGTVIVSWARSGSTRSGRDAELLDAAEEVVPAAGVETRGVLAQLVEDLVHLERGEDRLDQDGRPDRARAGCPGRPGPRRRRRSRGAPRGATRAWAGRSTGPLPRLSGSRALWKTYSPKSNRLAEIGSPSTIDVRARRGASRAAGRRASRSARSAGRPCPRASRTSSGRRTASAARPGRRPRSAQVGESESSRSAMKTRAPELRALIIIFGSAGPVISTRRSSRSAGAGATRQSAAADVGGLGQEVGHDRRRRGRAWRFLRAARSSAGAAPNWRWRSARNSSASGVRTRSSPSDGRPRTSTPGGGGHAAGRRLRCAAGGDCSAAQRARAAGAGAAARLIGSGSGSGAGGDPARRIGSGTGCGLTGIGLRQRLRARRRPGIARLGRADRLPATTSGSGHIGLRFSG